MKAVTQILTSTLLTLLLSFPLFTQAQTNQPKEEKKWFESLAIRGYSQVRYNGLFETNPDLGCEQCDKSWGGDNGFFLRRLRVILYGQITPRVYVYIQPDFASSASSSAIHFGQIRDVYFDLGLDKKNELRLRIGQSKVPFGFENMQSSQNRLPLDRADALNSAFSNERDLGMFLYWAPTEKRKLFSSLVKDGLKGSGDYGILAFGIFNGQTANKPELNQNRHVVARACYPFAWKNQILEFGIQAYAGHYTFTSSQLTSGVGINSNKTYIDQRVAATWVLYPKPLGILAEYNVGRGPEFDVLQDSITTQKLSGGYVTLSYKWDQPSYSLIPFVRYQKYSGGKKHELDARSYDVEDMEIGTEWQFGKNFELVATYTFSKRRYEDFAARDNKQKGQLLRLQAQINF